MNAWINTHKNKTAVIAANWIHAGNKANEIPEMQVYVEWP